MATRTTTFATNDVLTADALNSLAGAWNSYTPTLTGFTPDNGTATGSYLQFGKLVMFRAKFVFGTGTTAATATPKLSLPVGAKADGVWDLTGGFTDSGSARYQAVVIIASGVADLYIPGTNGLLGTCTTSSPFTWAATDQIEVAGTYEAA